MIGILLTFLVIIFCIGLDKLFYRFNGRYYLVHFLINMCIVVITLPDVLNIYSNYKTGLEISNSWMASCLTYGLHLYHIINYYNSLRFDDWLHHILMIGVALPIANYFGSVRIMGHSLFYLTGLPGGLDYFLLFLVRNFKIRKITEKRFNRFLNVWIRYPGSMIQLIATYLLINDNLITNNINKFLALLTGILVFWNGGYFMDQVVGNLYLEENRLKRLS